MSKYVTVSVKISKEIKVKLERYGIKPSELLKKAIIEELRTKEVEELERKSDELKEDLVKFSTKYVVKSIREDRDHR